MSSYKEAFETCLRLARENARLEGMLEEKDARIRDLKSMVRNSGGCKMTNTPSWHKLPPVPGWYSSAMTHGGSVEAVGTERFSEWKIQETSEQKNIWYYGPLPVWEIEHGGNDV